MIPKSRPATIGQRAKLAKLCRELGTDPPSGPMTDKQARSEIDELEAILFTIRHGMD